MPIRFTVHAREMIEEREIDVAWIADAVATPDWTDQDPQDRSLTRSFRAISAAGGRVLRVVHRDNQDDRLIVTVHFDRGARR